MSVLADTRGEAGAGYLLAVAAIGVAGLGGLAFLGQGFGDAVSGGSDGEGIGVTVASAAATTEPHGPGAGATDADPAAPESGDGSGVSVMAGVWSQTSSQGASADDGRAATAAEGHTASGEGAEVGDSGPDCGWNPVCHAGSVGHGLSTVGGWVSSRVGDLPVVGPVLEGAGGLLARAFGFARDRAIDHARLTKSFLGDFVAHDVVGGVLLGTVSLLRRLDGVSSDRIERVGHPTNPFDWAADSIRHALGFGGEDATAVVAAAPVTSAARSEAAERTRIDEALAAIAESPAGAALLAMTVEQGVEISVTTDVEYAAHRVSEGVLLHPDAVDGEWLPGVLAHELAHAAAVQLGFRDLLSETMPRGVDMVANEVIAEALASVIAVEAGFDRGPSSVTRPNGKLRDYGLALGLLLREEPLVARHAVDSQHTPSEGWAPTYRNMNAIGAAFLAEFGAKLE